MDKTITQFNVGYMYMRFKKENKTFREQASIFFRKFRYKDFIGNDKLVKNGSVVSLII